MTSSVKNCSGVDFFSLGQGADSTKLDTESEWRVGTCCRGGNLLDDFLYG